MSIEMVKRPNDGVCYFETTIIGDNELSGSHSVMVFQAWKRKCVPILLIALIFLFHLNVYPVSGHAADRPNIVFILADDLGSEISRHSVVVDVILIHLISTKFVRTD